MNIPKIEVTWDEARQVADLPEVSEAFGKLAEVTTGDNAIAAIRTVMQAMRDPAYHFKDHSEA
jgi:hypothetical protein